jgi:diguanylate cyclase (GGDEF)-like protein
MSNTLAQRVTCNARLYLFEQCRRRALDSGQRHILDDPCFQDAQEILSNSLKDLRNEQRTKCLSNLEACLAVKATIAVVAADMDRMMLMNDQFGHVIGDMVLLAVAQLFAEEFGDNFYQIGDGFWAFTAGREASSAAAALDSLRLQVKNLRFEGHPDLKPSISVGIAFSDGTESTAKDLFRMAEKGFWQAKRHAG